MNIRNRLVLIAVLVIAIIGIAILLSGKSAQAPVETTDMAENNVSTTTVTKPASSSSNNLQSIPTKDDVWNVWTQYLAFAKEKNVEGVKSLSYQVSESCLKPELKTECEEKMSSVYTAGANLRKADFVKLFADNKQAILKTDLKTVEEKEKISVVEGKIVFAVNSAGRLSILSLEPAQTWSVGRKVGSTTEEIKARLEQFTRDTDSDGLSDDLEKCVFPEDWIVFYCTETNPNKRDSDADGWWDGVEYYFKI